MSNISFKTRANSNPQGKQKVYFTCHPDDFEKTFEPITNDILKNHNCAIYYYPPNIDIPYDEIEFELAQMQLVVIPITSKFLEKDNHAYLFEFKFAQKHHIPILPLMQEEGLEEKFNINCGNLQYLHKHKIDDTTISYEEKLQKFLSSVLISDELTQKIREAFDAYIFLSYRKKDRRHAQKLMRLIHKNDFCRDIAIWYDEFLVPGENFNEAIISAMRKSKLFALVVTPNLLNEENYVMTTEYPMAQENNMHILPFESVKTDNLELQNKFANIPECTDIHNEKAISDSLLKAIKELAITSKSSSPEHTFFIGLAYLLGIDVEINYTKAIEMITSAANDKLIEAIDKLVEIYSAGIGVECSWQNAIVWQKNKIEILKLTLKNEYSDKTADELFWAFFECGNLLIETLNFEEAEEYFSQGLNLFEETQNGKQSFQVKYNMCASYHRLGDIYLADYYFDKAKECYEKALALSLELDSGKSLLDTKWALNITYRRLGDLYYHIEDYQSAQEKFKIAIDIAEADVRITGSTRMQYSLAESYCNIGSACEKMNLKDLAKDYYRKAITLCESLQKECESPKVVAQMANAHYYLSLVDKDLSHLGLAASLYGVLAGKYPEWPIYRTMLEYLTSLFADWKWEDKCK